MRRLIIFSLVALFLVNSVLATTEAITLPTTESSTANYWQEFDITFWQTAPFAVFWGNLLDQQLAASLCVAGAPHWDLIIGFATLVSVTNAAFEAKRAVARQ